MELEGIVTETLKGFQFQTWAELAKVTQHLTNVYHRFDATPETKALIKILDAIRLGSLVLNSTPSCFTRSEDILEGVETAFNYGVCVDAIIQNGTSYVDACKDYSLLPTAMSGSISQVRDQESEKLRLLGLQRDLLRGINEAVVAFNAVEQYLAPSVRQDILRVVEEEMGVFPPKVFETLKGALLPAMEGLKSVRVPGLQ